MLAVQERAPGEFARLGQPQAGKRQERLTIAAMTARPPVTLNSAMSSPVKLRGARKRMISARSSGSPRDGIAQRPQDGAAVGKLAPGASAASAAAQRGPDRRMTAIAARPAPEAGAKIVS